MEESKAKILAKKYKDGTCSPEERALVENWYNQLPTTDTHPDLQQIQSSMDEVWGRIQQGYNTKQTDWRPYAAAASLLVVGLFSFFYFKSYKSVPTEAVQDALPGQQEARLTLANGQRIQLSRTHRGISFIGAEIRYSDGLRLYNSVDPLLTGAVPHSYILQNDLNSIEAPIGGNYQIILADGSTVWLNSGSKLTFPSDFQSGTAREVSLSGEAFFAVSKDPKHRFSVYTKDQQINVLGTKFNVKSYPNQEPSKTTLVEGSVEIVNTLSGEHYGKKVILKPNEQVELNKVGLIKSTANTEKNVAWKEGLFIFNDDLLEDIMLSLSRWYKVDVDYASLPRQRFNGYISKDVKLSEVLNMLEITGRSTFKLENNTIRAYTKLK